MTDILNKYTIPFPQVISKLMKDKKLTQDQFSDIIGISQGMLSRVLNQGTVPSTDFMIRICKEFGVNPYVFFDFTTRPFYLKVQVGKDLLHAVSRIKDN